MFKNSLEYRKINQELENVLNKKARFSCCADGIFEYHLINDSVKHIFMIVAEDNFIHKMEIEWLLDLKRIEFFRHEIHLKYTATPFGEEEWQKEADMTFRQTEYKQLN